MKINFDMSLKLRENLVHKKKQFSQKISEKYRKKYSFKIKKITTAISEIPVINNYLNFDNAYLEKNKGHFFLNMVDEKEMNKKFLGYKFQAVLEKQ